MLRCVYMGTPDFAAQILSQLIEWKGCDIVAVYSQPDRPAGRGLKVEPTAVKKVALEHGIPVFQPVNFKEQSEVDALAALQPDVLLVAAYGLILPESVLAVPRLAPLNVHASLLPRYRGAAPIQRSIMAGDQVTGVSIMHMEKGLDTGPVYLQRALAIGMEDTCATLHDELANLGGRLLIEALPRLEAGTLKAVEQDHTLATYAAKLSKTDSQIDFNHTAWEVHAQIRGTTPYPGAWFNIARKGSRTLRILVEPGQMGPVCDPSTPPGTVAGLLGDALAISCSDRLYLFPRLRPSTRHRMSAVSFVNGYVTQKNEQGQPDFSLLQIVDQ
ncbi:MAG: methionyl-tRNA formyltransferase [Desulfovibrionaceae bacterium]|nr:methionyl-tRNA formyltransferase [Desulfovibrionaceae bacterium]